MAASRFEKYATIFTRTQGLLRTGALKDSHKPLWFDVYERFPPHIEPRALRPIPEKRLTKILYREDQIRAKFYKEYPLRTAIDLTESSKNYKPLSQKFIDKYIELSTSTGLVEDMFHKTEAALKSEGISLRLEKSKMQKRRKHENAAEKKMAEVEEDFIEDVNEFPESEVLNDYGDEPKGKPLKFDLKSVMNEK